MAYQVALLNFEGPLDLLLQLIDKSELDITEISLADLTTQYLDYLRQLSDIDPDELNRFVQMAAKLVHIKSLALLPQAAEDDPELIDLSRQLAEYAKYQEAAQHLSSLLMQKQVSYIRQAPTPNIDLPHPKLSTDDLSTAYQQIISRMPKLTRMSEPNLISIEQAIGKLTAQLDANQELELEKVIVSSGDRQAALVYFLAILELLKLRAIEVIQEGQFLPIKVCRV